MIDPDAPPRPRRKLLIVVIVALSLILLVILGFTRARRKPDLQFETSMVDRGRIVAKVTATGTLSPLVTVQVGSQVSGRIQALHADFNSSVKKGELIARIDPRLFEATVEQSRANLAAAQGNLAKAKAQAVDARLQHERAQALAKQNLVAEAELDTAKANADAAEAGVAASEGAVAQARAALHQAEINLAYTDIFSPTDGVVISRSVDVGQTVAASLQAPTLFTIAEDLQKMQVDTSVAEADVGKLRPGMEASFFVDAYPAERFRGRVRQIRNAPQTTQNVVTYDAVIDVGNPDLKLKPGMTANVTFVTADRDQVLRVPNAALRFRPPAEMTSGSAGGSPGAEAAHRGRWSRGSAPAGSGSAGGGPEGRRVVWVLRGSDAKPVSILPGVSDGTLSEVAEGELHEGEKVIIGVSGGEPAAPQTGGPNPFRRVF